MLASFEYSLSREEYGRGLQVIGLSLLERDRWRSYRCLLLLAVIGVAIAFSVYFNPGSFDGILLAFGIFWVSSSIMQVRYQRRWREMAYDPVISHRTLKLDETGIFERHAEGAANWSWKGVRRIHELSDAIIVEVSDWHAITLPHRLWAGVEERSEFIKLVRERATNALPDIKSAWTADPGARLLSVGAIAAGLDAFVLMSLFEGRLMCPCSIYRMLGHSYALYAALWMVAPFIAATVAWFVTRACLKFLSRRYPTFTSALAKLFIAGVCVALLAGPFIKS